MLAVAAPPGGSPTGDPGFGMLLDDKLGRDALFAAGAGQDLWVARPIELPGSRPLQFEFSARLGSHADRMAGAITASRCLCFYHPDDDAELKAAQTAKLVAAFDAARKVGREMLHRDHRLQGRAAQRRHGRARARPNSTTPASSPTGGSSSRRRRSRRGRRSTDVIAARDPLCRGVVLLGLEAPIETLKESFAAARAAEEGPGLRRRADHLRRGGRALAQRRNWRRGGHRRHGREVRRAGRSLAVVRSAIGGLRGGAPAFVGAARKGAWQGRLDGRDRRVREGWNMVGKTVRLTVAQALVRFLANQMTVIDGEKLPIFAGCWAIFGHGNVAGIGEALYQARDRLADLSRPQRAGDGPCRRSPSPRRASAAA